ncbi:aldo/keto reductase [Bifidobacterium bombi]|uniref:2,5-diketo-D-gluconic acid reductase n=1 Tax=Bifidobacterium bombi DSM 19703 TaxID=1341695 RepID=A0A080N6A2_9BIFI|nr:aldo/keto reductase [Bifidobacterium bombi]KFF31424.1 2,5-diketo-D-gluconic acid reductase [Bifidobacterium bombi DSM 19703]
MDALLQGTDSSTMPTRIANDGLILPAIGFGTGAVAGNRGVDTIVSALDAGYRLLDTAVNYENEGTVGKAIHESGIEREQIIVSSKLPGRFQGYDDARRCIEESAFRMGLDYIDIYLIHWPNPSQAQYVQAWRALIDAREEGLVRHIGVSNFLPGHIEMLLRATGVAPAVNQVELHPYFQQHEQMSYDEAHGIITQAWCPLGRANQLLADPSIVSIAHKHEVDPASVILRWHVQLGDVAIPKSSNPKRQKSNLDVMGFELDEQDMRELRNLDNPQGRCFGSDPRFHEES